MNRGSSTVPGNFADRIRSGEILVGTVLSFPGTALTELASGPFDFVWIDLEHGALSVQEMQNMAIGAKATGCAALARLPRYDAECLTAVLDAGLDGVVAPRIETASEAAEFAKFLRYPPLGTRGFGPRRAGAYGRGADFWKSAHSTLACLVQIETAKGLAAVEDIAAVSGIDAIVVGCADLSLALGTPLDVTSAPMIAAIRGVQTAATRAGVASGIAASGDPDAIAQLVAEASTMVVYSADVRIYSRAIDSAARSIFAVLGSRSQRAIRKAQE